MTREQVRQLQEGDTVRLRGSRRLYTVWGSPEQYRKSPGSANTEMRISLVGDDGAFYDALSNHIAEKTGSAEYKYEPSQYWLQFVDPR